MSRKIIITGCPRSGTKYISHVMQKCGLDIGHNKVWGKDGISSWLYAAIEAPGNSIVLCQVRNPVDTIGSLQTIGNDSWEFFDKHIRCGLDNNMALRGMRAWLRWNRLAMEKAIFTYRVEDIESQWDRICELIGIDHSLPNIPTDTNTRQDRYEQMRLSDLHLEDSELCDQIVEMASGLGYELFKEERIMEAI